MRFAKICTLSIVLAGTTAPAFCSEAKVGTTVINVSAPNGQCEITGATPSEAEAKNKVHELLSKGHQVIALYADCDQLKHFRQNSSGGFQDFAQYIVQSELVDRVLPEIAVSQVCDASRKFTKTTYEQIEKMIQADTERAGLRVEIEEMNFLGVLGEEAGACYSGSVTRRSGGRLQLGIVANVLVKGKFITYQIYGPYRGKHSVDELLERHKANVAAFKAINSR